jgi:ribose transport system permease protein
VRLRGGGLMEDGKGPKKGMGMKKKNLAGMISNLALPIFLLVSVVVFALLNDKFFTPLNLTNILVQNFHIAVLSTAVLILMVIGGIDLSIGFQISVVAVLIAKTIKAGALPIWLAICLGILVCVLLALFNGLMSRVLKSHTMIISLGTMAVFQGISYLISGSKTFGGLPKAFMYIGQGRLWGWLPLNGVIALVLIVAIGVLLQRTYLGRHLYAVGDNPEAARLAGLNVWRIKFIAYGIAGALVGVTAVLLSARTGSADSSMGPDLTFTGITACVLAGVALKGGEGTLWKVIVAVFVLGVLANGMQLIGLGTYPQYIAKGTIMLAAIYLSNRTQKTA